MPCGLMVPLEGSGTLQAWMVGGLQMVCNGRYIISINFEVIKMGVIIPALMHWIPSELRSQACLDESSTRMGDLLGNPRVATLLIFVLFIFISTLFSIIFMEIFFFFHG